MIDGKNVFDQLIKVCLRTNDNIRITATGEGDDYTTGCPLDYPYFKEDYELVVKDLSKQQALDAHPKAIQQIYFTGNLKWDRSTQIFFIHEEE